MGQGAPPLGGQLLARGAGLRLGRPPRTPDATVGRRRLLDGVERRRRGEGVQRHGGQVGNGHLGRLAARGAVLEDRDEEVPAFDGDLLLAGLRPRRGGTAIEASPRGGMARRHWRGRGGGRGRGAGEFHGGGGCCRRRWGAIPLCEKVKVEEAGSKSEMMKVRFC